MNTEKASERPDGWFGCITVAVCLVDLVVIAIGLIATFVDKTDKHVLPPQNPTSFYGMEVTDGSKWMRLTDDGENLTACTSVDGLNWQCGKPQKRTNYPNKVGFTHE